MLFHVFHLLPPKPQIEYLTKSMVQYSMCTHSPYTKYCTMYNRGICGYHTRYKSTVQYGIYGSVQYPHSATVALCFCVPIVPKYTQNDNMENIVKSTTLKLCYSSTS